jgi:uncharacterized protein YjbJ (UPF0337 family)
MACHFSLLKGRLPRTKEEDTKEMGLPNKDEVEGKFDQAKGAVKENVGRAIDNEEMETEGAADRAGGKIQEGYGEAKRKVGDAVKDIGDKIRS